MYQLYYSPGACSLATQVILRELGQDFSLISKAEIADYSQINPVGAVPALKTGDTVVTEGAAIILYLLERHANQLLPTDAQARGRVIEALMFANASMHPAYSKLFFLAGSLEDSETKMALLSAAAQKVSALWEVVESRLEVHAYLAGEVLSPADILLAVYAAWGEFFPVRIEIGRRSKALIDSVRAMPSYRASVAAEQSKVA
ncbi:glutathione S-transferase family protein [Gilvimarinus algae]|uniref:Glutathione S-transferase family protein n=1 Tax=Gilvimarinus algae TaxID=3058037 RepID=A0ABT8TNI4_9GAMM|nr:glutathione S-transferase family protein [Gilvimarinus sp. SDUM040014]MDO3383967.1 glutathione S-transferase family protein [Gilvimarinus sp. SDUM040014]